ncbi:MAG: hypothetical protein PT958_02870 [Firmicutes bacterium]|nr:hypothetical protein [Bacillota bacterium]
MKPIEKLTEEEADRLALMFEIASSSVIHKSRAGAFTPTRLAIISFLSLPQRLT